MTRAALDPALVAALGLPSPDFADLLTPPPDVGEVTGLGVVLIREDTEADARVSLAAFAAILDAAGWWLSADDEPDAEEQALAATVRGLRAALFPVPDNPTR